MKFFFKHQEHSRRDDPFIIQEGRLSDSELNGLYRHRWVEESWAATGENGAGTPLKEFLGISVSPWRLKLFGCLVALGLMLIFGRLIYLQAGQGEHYRQLAENNRLRSKPILAERGIIYDRNFTPLVANIPIFSLLLVPQDLPKEPVQREEVLQKISALSGLPLEELKEKITDTQTASFRSISLRENLDYQTAMLLTIKSADLPGVNLDRGYNRLYSYTNSFTVTSTPIKKSLSSLAHLLGYMGKLNKDELTLNKDYLPTDYIGKTGLEKSYENILRGKYGLKRVEVDALGKEKNTVTETPPEVGKSLILSLDFNYQQKLEEILKNNLRAAGKKRGSAIVLNAQNGEILALVNLPSFDSNLFAQGISSVDYQKLLTDSDAPLFSRAWSGNYPSGSVIKPIISAAAMAEGIITRNTTFLSTGGLQVESWFFPDWKAGGHGPTNVIKALAESVNTFFYIIGGGFEKTHGLGLDKISLYLKKFGLGNTLGVDLPNESAGFIPTREWKEDAKHEPWYIGDTYNISIGQGDLLVTPLQVAAYTAAIANGGTLYRPHLVSAALDPVNKVQYNVPNQTLAKNIVADNYLAIVREGMHAAVAGGSARSLYDLPVEVAAKTGTAQWSKKAPTHAWFTSFAPYRNPKIVITVMIEEGGEGSTIAAPVAKEFYAWWANRQKQGLSTTP